MQDPFADYGAQATKPIRPAPLVAGPMVTRAQARTVYAGIVTELAACEDQDTLDLYLMTVGEELIQFETELEFLWSGDGQDFAGLYKEIEQAKLRVSGF
jgi:hypothetical protein